MKRSSVGVVFGREVPGFEQEVLCVWNPRLGGWTLPGGKAEPGEEPLETMKREVFEETGARVSAAELIFSGIHTTQLGPWDVSVFLITEWTAPTGTVTQPNPQHEPNAPVGWLSVGHFLRYSPFSEFYAQFLPGKRYE